jgi:hypothetical protein
MPYNGLESVVEGLCTGREGSAMSALANYIRRQVEYPHQRENLAAPEHDQGPGAHA